MEACNPKDVALALSSVSPQLPLGTSHVYQRARVASGPERVAAVAQGSASLHPSRSGASQNRSRNSHLGRGHLASLTPYLGLGGGFEKSVLQQNAVGSLRAPGHLDLGFEHTMLTGFKAESCDYGRLEMG